MKIRLVLTALSFVLPAAAQAAGIELSGFGSVYLAKPFASEIKKSIFVDKSINSSLSLMGLNVNAPIDGGVSFSSQLVASSVLGNGWDVAAKWAYLAYEPMERLRFKAGRQVYPLFLNSENADVKFNLPFNRIPEEVTTLVPFKGFDGVSAEHTYLLRDLKLNVSVMFGRSHEVSNTEKQNTVGDLVGGNVAIVGNGWEGRAHVSRTSLDSSPTTANLGIYSAGGRWDKYSVLLQGEYIHTDASNGHNDGGYGLVGYHLGRYTPRYMFARALGALAIDRNVTTHDVGVNFQVNPRLIAKADLELSHVNRGDAHAAYVGLDFLF